MVEQPNRECGGVTLVRVEPDGWIEVNGMRSHERD